MRCLCALVKKTEERNGQLATITLDFGGSDLAFVIPFVLNEITLKGTHTTNLCVFLVKLAKHKNTHDRI